MEKTELCQSDFNPHDARLGHSRRVLEALETYVLYKFDWNQKDSSDISGIYDFGQTGDLTFF